MMLGSHSPVSPSDHSKYDGDSRRERSMSISSRNSSRDGKHSPSPYKKRKTEGHEDFLRDHEKSPNRSVRSLYRHDRKSKGDDLSGSDLDDYRDSILDMEESVDPSICNFRGSTLQKNRKNSGKDRLKHLEKIMAKMVQNNRSPSEHSHYGSQEDERDRSNSRMKNLEKMIEKIVKNNIETSAFMVPTEPNGPVTSLELIPRNSNFTTSMWLNKINEECLERGFDEKTCIKFLETKMTGLVKSWYKTLGSIDLTWPELKMLITQTFPDNSEFATTLRLLVNRFKKPKETITQYYFSKMYLIDACRISGVFAVSCLIDGLMDPKVKTDAKAYQFLTPESLYSLYLDKLPDHDELSHMSEKDQPNNKDETDQPNHKDEKDQQNQKDEMDQANHKDKMARPNHKVTTNQPNHPKKHIKGRLGRSNFLNSGMEHPNHSYVDSEQPYAPNYGIQQPNLPNYMMGQPNFDDEFQMGQPSHPNFSHDYETEQPHPNFGMGPDYGMEQPHPDFGMGPDYGMEQPHPDIGMGPDYGMEQPHPDFGMGPDYGMEQPHPDFGMGPDYGMEQPHSSNFGRGPDYEIEPWHRDPSFVFEYSHPRHPDYGNVSSRNMGERPEKAIPVCLNCSKLGHLAANCWFPKKCTNCRKKGHIAPLCRNKNDAPAIKKKLKDVKRKIR